MKIFLIESLLVYDNLIPNRSFLMLSTATLATGKTIFLTETYDSSSLAGQKLFIYALQFFKFLKATRTPPFWRGSIL